MISKNTMEQLKQIAKSPVWDGNLISKTDRNELYKLKLINRAHGYNFLTAEGIKMCLDLNILKP